MSYFAYKNGCVLLDGAFRDDVTVLVENGTIRDVVPADEALAAVYQGVDLEGDLLLPGFIDVQVNGGGGVLFNEQPTVEGIRAIAAAHAPFGTSGLLPTLISDDLEVIHKGLTAVKRAIEEGVPGVLGIHIEGPFLEKKRRGVHDSSKLRELSEEIVNSLEPLPNGVTLLTLAPDRVDSALIRRLTEKGFIVSAGHSNATAGQVKQAVGAGMSGFTHLFNAMSQLKARNPGVVGAALGLDQCWCGIIADGHHVAAESLQVALRCKGPSRLMLVTDAMPPAGTALNEFELLGQKVTVRDGVLRALDGTLAGTALDMASAVRNMARLTGCPIEDAVQMASSTPAEFIGLGDRIGAIRAGYVANFVIANDSLEIKNVIQNGQSI